MYNKLKVVKFKLKKNILQDKPVRSQFATEGCTFRSRVLGKKSLLKSLKHSYSTEYEFSFK